MVGGGGGRLGHVMARHVADQGTRRSVLPVTGTQAGPRSWRVGQQETGTARYSATTVIRGVLDRHRVLIKNVLTLLATTGLSLALGFGYWNIAARLFSQDSVGYGSAAISAMTFLSSFGTFGLNTLLVGELPRRTRRGGLIAAAMLAAAMGALVLAIGFVAIAPHFTTHYADVAGSVGRSAIFCAGVSISAASVVFDAATIGMLRGGLQLTRNLTFVLTKIVTLLGVALALHYTTGMGIYASWVAAIPVSLFVVAIRLRVGGGTLILPRPDWAILRGLVRSLAAHNWLNLALQVPALLIPVLAASILAPSTNAAYYIATTITGGLFILPAHMSTVLFAMGSADPRALPGRLRFALRVTLLVGLAGAATLGLGAHFILGIFGPGYARIAALPMEIMAVACLPSIPNSFYISVARATNRLSQAAALVTFFTVLDVIASVGGALKGGLVGMTVAGFAVITAEALVTTPFVIRAAREQGKHRRAAPTAAMSSAVVDSGMQEQRRGGAAPRRTMSERERQQLRGLALLVSLATPNTVTMMAITTDSDDGRQPPVSTSDASPNRDSAYHLQEE
jgi:O-antigen/teichoic acid export membrane protein